MMGEEFRKIDLFIVGAQKAGTTSLFNYLKEHPLIEGHISQELSYFINDDEYKKGCSFMFKKYYNKYNKNNKSILIAKNAGLYVNETAIKRLHNHNKDCKIVYILREPVSRTISSFLMEKNSGWLKNDFKELPNEIKKHENGKYSLMYKLFINQSLYLKHLTTIYKYFNKENVYIYLFDDFKTQPIKIYKDIIKKLNIDIDFTPNFKIIYNQQKSVKSENFESFLHKFRKENNIIKRLVKKLIPYKIFIKVSNYILKLNRQESTKNKFLIDSKTVEFLKDFYKKYNDELSQFCGIDLTFWNK